MLSYFRYRNHTPEVLLFVLVCFGQTVDVADDDEAVTDAEEGNVESVLMQHELQIPGTDQVEDNQVTVAALNIIHCADPDHCEVSGVRVHDQIVKTAVVQLQLCLIQRMIST